MENLILHIYKRRQDNPEKTVTIPLKTINFSLALLPKEVKASLEREGIDISQCRELVKEKVFEGTLIEIESSDEKLVISVK